MAAVPTLAHRASQLDYVEWAHERAIPSQRLGMASSASIFGLLFVVTCALGASGRVEPRALLAWLLSFAVPLVVIALGPVALGRGRRRYAAWFVASNAVNSIFLVVWAGAMGTGEGDVYVLLTGAVSSVFIAGVARQPPVIAIVAAAPATLAAAAVHSLGWLDGRIDGVTLALDVLALLLALGIGGVVAVGSDAQHREAHRQERIIESQRETIAKQQALLEKELSHQVAERSRELGAVLARSDVTLDVRALKTGERFAERYKILSALGAGGMGAVYEVERVTDGATLALKVVVGEVSGASAARFAREAEIGARLRHPNLISIVDVGVSSGVPFLAMELVRGGSLEAQRGKFGDVAWALPILKQIAEGLAALHEAGVVHRDLKPANVLLADGGVAKISDFGISRFGELDDTSADANAATMAATPKRSSELTGTGVVMGTPLYMAPEGAKSARALDASADVFAFGIIAYEMLTGRAPFAVPAFVLAMAGQPVPPPPPIDEARVAAELGGMITSALAGDPALRPRVRAFLAALG